MLRYILKRLLLMVPVLMGVSLLIFGLQFIAPGNPAQLILGDQATQVDIDAFNTKYGLDNSFLVQYTSYIWDIVTKGDFGVSYRTGKKHYEPGN
ncbi:MAG: hypothetical protein ACOX62_05780 [Christensenellales bacterium]